MSTSIEPPEPSPGSYQAGSLVVKPRPSEVGFALREDEFQILCDGQISDARAGRDLCVGLCVGTVVAIIGVLATNDWQTVWQPARRSHFLIFLAILLLIAGGSAAGWIIFQLRLTQTKDKSPYSRLRVRISEYFSNRLEGDDSSHDKKRLAILSARYGAQNTWKDVAPLLRAAIRDETLRIGVENDNLGGDPLRDVVKRLEVTYAYDGLPFSRTVQEHDVLSLP